ncbi:MULTISPECIES: ABC transporter ATP-binding protein [Nitrospirillum]|uniref:Sulfonate ABC transporter ATP-binding protein n=1 Tax=Nitrospirillum viridazoti CBAmc TaxID=1441467 RepID=A0A248JW27_9PROT|nr:sulfonate ABC transporter ATP-binding protein [Nitrospirillum amazonense CBAmc]TWB31454.1 sulfonate transport system ATP-binding protein [Nitrospirillum amazonense]
MASNTAPLTAAPLTADSSTASSDAAVRVRGFSRRFGDVTVLRDLDLDIAPGEFVALLGRSGSGKTTLLRTLAGLDAAPAEQVSTPGARAVVFQEPRLLPWKKVWRNITLGLKGGRTRLQATAALEEVGLGHRVDAWPATLSGGEAQRAALARALVREPQLLLLDEPFAALDALTRLRMHQLVLSLWRAHRPAVLLVTHDVDEAIALADRILVLADGRLAVEEKVALARPREAGPEFQALRRRLLGHLGVEQPLPRDTAPLTFIPPAAGLRPGWNRPAAVNGHAVNGHAVNGHGGHNGVLNGGAHHSAPLGGGLS